jgi:hypothetical protein
MAANCSYSSVTRWPPTTAPSSAPSLHRFVGVDGYDGYDIDAVCASPSCSALMPATTCSTSTSRTESDTAHGLSPIWVNR